MSDEQEKEIKELQILLDESAPAWVVTFGDLMSLLLCFFVLLLSFSETNKAKYKAVAGSLREAFGLQRDFKNFESPMGLTIISTKIDDHDIMAPLQKTEFVRKAVREKYVEGLEEDIRDKLEVSGHLVDIQRSNDKIVIRFMGEAIFNSGQSNLRKEMKPVLVKFMKLLKNKMGKITISGHTDNIPMKSSKMKSNLRLSMERATSVAEFFLLGNFIDPKRISTVGYGPFRPIASNDTAEGREKNRRVEIAITVADGDRNLRRFEEPEFLIEHLNKHEKFKQKTDQ